MRRIAIRDGCACSLVQRRYDKYDTFRKRAIRALDHRLRFRSASMRRTIIFMSFDSIPGDSGVVKRGEFQAGRERQEVNLCVNPLNTLLGFVQSRSKIPLIAN